VAEKPTFLGYQKWRTNKKINVVRSSLASVSVRFKLHQGLRKAIARSLYHQVEKERGVPTHSAADGRPKVVKAVTNDTLVEHEQTETTSAPGEEKKVIKAVVKSRRADEKEAEEKKSVEAPAAKTATIAKARRTSKKAAVPSPKTDENFDAEWEAIKAKAWQSLQAERATRKLAREDTNRAREEKARKKQREEMDALEEAQSEDPTLDPHSWLAERDTLVARGFTLSTRDTDKDANDSEGEEDSGKLSSSSSD
jgi:type IV secretory pathway VirB10-like protein